MILGLGIDTVTISEVQRFMKDEQYAVEVFTDLENEAAREESYPADYYSRVYAVKEACFKALDHLMGEHKDFDFSMVETCHRPDGSPYINVGPELHAVLNSIGVKKLYVSMTTEGDFATAIVIAEG